MRKSVEASGHKFSQVPSAEIQRSTFDRSHGHKTSFDGGYLVPVLVDEVLPGDTFNCRAHIFARQATPFQPLLDNMRLTSFTFFCPTRLVWLNHHKFMGAQDDPGDSVSFSVPQVITHANATIAAGGTMDHMGIPPVAVSKSINVLPFRCDALIYNEWFRSEDLQDSVLFSNDDGPDLEADYRLLRRRGKRHDYFTGALPFLQKGPTTPLIISGTYPVTANANLVPQFRPDGEGVGDERWLWATIATDDVDSNPGTWSATGKLEWAFPNLEVDFDTGSPGVTNTINELRMAFQIQKLYERDARGGTRYTEIIRSHFGVTSPDARLQRPEFLGGGTQMINTTPVPVSSDANSGVVGELGAYAISSGSNHSWAKSFTEHGYIITYVSVQADLTYQRGVHRMWTRTTKHDFYWPALSHVGEQIVRNDEIWADGSANDLLTFGFVPRYDEYRHKPSGLSNLMRSDHASTLDVWHLAQDLTALPVLGNTFIQDTPPIARVSAITDEDDFIMDIHFEYKCTRPMPTFGVPGLIDHF